MFVISCNSVNNKSNAIIEYYPDQKIKIMTIENSGGENLQISFDDDGNIKLMQKKKDSTNDGQSIWFYDDGVIQNTLIFNNGKASGNGFWFYNDGAIKSHGYWKNDMLSGYATNYYQDSIGTLKNIVFYDDNGKVSWQKESNHSLGISISRDSLNKH